MSEETAINVIKNMVTNASNGIIYCKKCSCGEKAKCVRNKKSCLEIASRTILDLYQKEKETSHFLQSKLDEANAKIIELKEEYKNEQLSELKELNNYVRKSIIKEKIKEKQSKINKMHPASDIVIIDDLENQIED